MTVQIAEAIDEVLQPRGVAVLADAEHMCMSMRGVRKEGSRTLTTRFTGVFAEDPAEQVRFLTLVAAEPVMSSAVPFAPPGGKAALEEGRAFTPRFGPDGLITCVTATPAAARCSWSRT
jgi:hypothetical protein